MNKNIINRPRLVLLMLSLIMVSCTEDLLDTSPTDAIDRDQVFESIITAEASLIGAYDALSAYTFEGMWVPLMSDIMGDDVMINSVDNWNWFVSVYQLNVLPNYTYTTYPWRQGYKIIFDANNIIHYAKDIPDADPERINKLVGQAKVLRAFTMHKLVQMYAPSYYSNSDADGIMIVTEPLNASDEDLGRSSVSEVYNQIEADLLSAIGLLENDFDKGFFDKRAAQAILARVYLDMHNWTGARDVAKEAHQDIELMSITDYYGGFYSRNSETIFTVAYTAEDNNVYMSIPSFYWPVAGYSSIRANNQFVDLFTSSDARKGNLHFQDDIDPDRSLILKFAHNAMVGNAERISIRASEMVLIEAECEAELGNYSEAQDALFLIQQRSISGVVKSNSTGQTLIDEILLERRKELFGEGFRLNDLKRRNLPLDRTGDHWVKFNFGHNDPDYYRLTFPVPQSEIDANSMINEDNQNPGY